MRRDSRCRSPRWTAPSTGNGGGRQDALYAVPAGSLPVSMEGELIERRIRRGGAGREDEDGDDCSRSHWPPRSSCRQPSARDRKSTRLNSSHGYISYAVFCLKKK